MRFSAAVRFVRNRLIQAVPVLLIVAIGVFCLLELSKGDAVDAYLAQTGTGSAEIAATMRDRYGISDSTGMRFIVYANRLLKFDLGHSIAFNRPVLTVIVERLPNTLLMMLAAILLSASLGVVLGSLTAIQRGRPVDTFITLGALVLNAMPGFWLGLLAIIIFAVKLRWFPIGGIATFDADLSFPASVLDRAWHLVLPVSTLALTYLALYLRLMRGAMIDASTSGWVTAAKARGLPVKRIVLRHMARPALLPVITMLGLQTGSLLGGSVVIETVFAIPGMGSLAYDAVSQRDLPLLAGILLAGTTTVILINLVVDALYHVLDPRVGAQEDNGSSTQ